MPSQNWQTGLLATRLNANSFAGLKFGAASAILPRLFISDYYIARDSKELTTLGITHVVSVLDYDPEIPDLILASRKLWIQLDDRPDVDILSELETATTFIAEALRDPRNKVLVHCFQGISRSATVVCAYLISTGMTVSASLKLAKAKRKIVRPNAGFLRQLEQYAVLHPPPPKQRLFWRAGKPNKKEAVAQGIVPEAEPVVLQPPRTQDTHESPGSGGTDAGDSVL